MSGPLITKRRIDVDVLKLISAVKKHECLWNAENKNFNKRGAVTVRAWMDVAEKVGKEATDLRAKWKNLKDAYRKELKKNYIDGEYKGIWQYFDELDFLKNSIITDLTEIVEETFSDNEINEEVQEVIRADPSFKRKTDYGSIKLIAEIKKHECLWKKSHSPNSIARYRAWKEISDKLGKSVSQLRQKWKNLRYAYKKEVMHNYVNGEYKGTWQYFNMMNFVKVDACEINDNNDEALSEGDQSDPEMPEAHFESEIENQIKVEVEAVDNLDYLDETYLEEDSTAEKRPRIDDNEYDLMFLKSLVPFFRGLDPVRKLVLRSKIQDMVMNELASSS